MDIGATLNYWFLQTVAMTVTALLIPKLRITSIFGALITVISLAAINATVWDAALFLSMPQAFTTQAGLLLATNGAIFWILVKLLPGIEVEGVFPAIIAPVVFAICSILISHYGKHIDWPAVFEFVVSSMGELKEHFYETTDVQPSPIPTPPL